jgi:hypothetical protein
VRDSFFKDQQEASGGAIRIQDTGMAASILDCAFTGCRATPGYGGAIYSEARGTIVSGCCGNRCRSFWGHFVRCQGSLSPLNCAFTTIVECSYSGDTDAAQGAIAVVTTLASGSSDFTFLNFTACYSEAASSVIAAFNDHPYRCNFLTVRAAKGATGIDNQGSFMPIISNSNFYGSTLSYAVLYFRTVGMEVSNSIFSDNSKDIGRASDATGTITLTGCVFSGSKQTSDWLSYDESCDWVSVPESHALCHVNTAFCPRDPCATRSPVPTHSRPFAPSGASAESASAPNTALADASLAGADASRDFSQSASPSRSFPLPPSSLLSQRRCDGDRCGPSRIPTRVLRGR